jgi:hypothetical protein
MKHPLRTTLLIALLASPISAFAVDPASLPDIKKTKLGLYIEAKEVPEFLKKTPKPYSSICARPRNCCS